MSDLGSSIAADPGAWLAVFTAIFAPIGTAIAWLYRESKKDRASHRACEVKVATLTEQLCTAQNRITGMEASIETLTLLLKREIHLD